MEDIENDKLSFLSDYENPRPLTASGSISPIDWKRVFSSNEQGMEQNSYCAAQGYVALASVVEAAYNIKNGSNIRLSGQSVLDCKGCNQSVDFVADYGVLNKYPLFETSSYPWTGDMGGCKADTFSAKSYKPVEWEISYFQRKSITPEMAFQVLQRGPYLFRQQFTFPRNYNGGIYDPDRSVYECSSFYYTSLLVGYGIDSATGQEYWTVKSPFGSNWGENGYIRVKRSDSNFNYGITCAYAQPRFD